MHLAARHRGFALKATYRPRPKEQALELEWRIGRQDDGGYQGYFAVDLELLEPPRPLEQEAAKQILELSGLALLFESPRPFGLSVQGRRARLVFATEIAPGKSRRHRLEIRVLS